MTWIAHVMGLDDAAGVWYLFYSGIGSCFIGLGVIGGLITTVRKHNCHVHRCPRVGRYPVAGTPFIVCQRHHPNGPPSANNVIEAGDQMP